MSLNVKNKILITPENINILSDEDVDKAKANNALDKNNIRQNKDLMYIKFKLCHVGANKNKDYFTEEELRENYDTALYKPVNWEHNPNEIIGCIYDSYFVDKEPDDSSDANLFVPYIECYCVIYKYEFPVKARIIEDRCSRGNLAFSMEVWFESAQCSECDKIFTKSKDYCNCLKTRRSTGSNTSRVFKGITFGGSGIVKKPADPDAEGKVIAGKSKSELDEYDIDLIMSLITTFNDVEIVIELFLERLKNDDLIDQDKVRNRFEELLNKFTFSEANYKGDFDMPDTFTKQELDDAVAKAVAKATKALQDEFDKKDTEKEHQKAISAKDTEIDSLKNDNQELEQALEDAKKETDSIKAAIEKGNIAKARIQSLKEDGITFDNTEIESIGKLVADMSDDEFDIYKKSLANLVKANEKNKSSKTPDIKTVPNYENDNNDEVDEFEQYFAAAFISEE